MKKITNLLLTFIFFPILFLSCGEDYQMPHEPGINIDMEALQQRSSLWTENKSLNYSYTYSFKNYAYPDAYTVDIIVANGTISSFTLKEYQGETETSTSNKEWTELNEKFKTRTADKNQFLIENVYLNIENICAGILKKYESNRNCYYANSSFGFIDEAPYLSSCKLESILMQKDVDGNYSNIEITLTNFTLL